MSNTTSSSGSSRTGSAVSRNGLPDPTIRWRPSYVRLREVTLSHPTTLWRCLTSSVPRRQFAVLDVTLSFGSVPKGSNSDSNSNINKHWNDWSRTSSPHRPGGSEKGSNSVVLLLGPSSSGKSTILSLIKGTVQPAEGTVDVGCRDPPNGPFEGGDDRDGTTTAAAAAWPVLLNERDPIPRQAETVGERLRKAVRSCCGGNGPLPDEGGGKDGGWTEALLEDLSTVWELSLQRQLSSLTPSEYYRFRLAQACIESSLHHRRRRGRSSASVTPGIADDGKWEGRQGIATPTSWALPGPVLLLDEWLDVEAGAVVRKVLPSLQRAGRDLGAVIVCVTHRPSLFEAAAKPGPAGTAMAGRSASARPAPSFFF